MTEIKRRNNRRRGKKFDWSKGRQTKPRNLPDNKNGIPIQGNRKPKRRNFPGGGESGEY